MSNLRYLLFRIRPGALLPLIENSDDLVANSQTCLNPYDERRSSNVHGKPQAFEISLLPVNSCSLRHTSSFRVLLNYTSTGGFY
ncbi:hypothetical protein M407DRAFT_204668 [Tulasnella calospora MUT 4182]|uniref:Uncharacterized protein n=1 Tax=Tulasnella calospora MUT 4182 TaxID=1051891 RepID=A0A0C3QUL8_9AGAM|nr:hypothetical protein M407DRAFT_204668 [Tulasnella calospora MUT 4182]